MPSIGSDRAEWIENSLDDEPDILVPTSVGARRFLGAPGRLAATGTHLTSHHLQRDKTFLHVRVFGTSGGKRTWPLSKKAEGSTSSLLDVAATSVQRPGNGIQLVIY